MIREIVAFVWFVMEMSRSCTDTNSLPIFPLYVVDKSWDARNASQVFTVVYLCVCLKCAVWCHQGVCHCNSHKKSDYWSRLRNTALLGTLSTFNLTLSEIDTHLRHAGTHTHKAVHNVHTRGLQTRVLVGIMFALMRTQSWTCRWMAYCTNAILNVSSFCPETMLQSFKVELSTAFTSFLKGKPAEEFDQRQSNQKGLIHEWVKSRAHHSLIYCNQICHVPWLLGVVLWCHPMLPTHQATCRTV